MTKPVLIIYTGGTIGMVNDPETGALCPFNFDQIACEVPEIKEFGFTIDSYTLPEIIDSSDLQPQLWKDLCQIILKNYDDYRGFVILHGTDTMAYSASALSFMLNNLTKPVVFTGSQLPIGNSHGREREPDRRHRDRRGLRQRAGDRARSEHPVRIETIPGEQDDQD